MIFLVQIKIDIIETNSPHSTREIENKTGQFEALLVSQFFTTILFKTGSGLITAISSAVRSFVDSRQRKNKQGSMDRAIRLIVNHT